MSENMVFQDQPSSWSVVGLCVCHFSLDFLSYEDVSGGFEAISYLQLLQQLGDFCFLYLYFVNWFVRL